MGWNHQLDKLKRQKKTSPLREFAKLHVFWCFFSFVFSENKDDAFPTDKQVAMQGLFMGVSDCLLTGMAFQVWPPICKYTSPQIIMESHGPLPQKVV